MLGIMEAMVCVQIWRSKIFPAQQDELSSFLEYQICFGKNSWKFARHQSLANFLLHSGET
ncbi:hypothetical protein MTR67_003374 [Solanum verrucosum]|uniref:Uncharacterized protein n=1 Tax=Solanum verrucosum TaxID=315347 RepID=A0AAF0PRX3_SOLVR|nr:hypothetical protein MTR67_003374 [Solanum verrucosum]